MDTSMDNTEEMVWIYTGVVNFLPTTAKYLHSLLSGWLRDCTKGGLESLCRQGMEREKESRGREVGGGAEEEVEY